MKIKHHVNKQVGEIAKEIRHRDELTHMGCGEPSAEAAAVGSTSRQT